MPSYRRLRREARRISKAGFHPVFVVNGNGQFRSSAAVIVLRVAWHYRSELAPVLVAAAVFVAGWFAHASTPHLWAVFIIVPGLAAWILVTFGAWFGLPELADRVYAGVCVFLAGGWIAYAVVAGPLTSPLPLVLGLLALLLAVPWWADLRRQALARLQRMLARWPQLAREIGLPGSVLQSVSLDGRGWRAWLHLANGQTMADVVALIPRIESALGTVRGAVTVYPAHNGRADWCELYVLGDPPGAA